MCTLLCFCLCVEYTAPAALHVSVVLSAVSAFTYVACGFLEHYCHCARGCGISCDLWDNHASWASLAIWGLIMRADSVQLRCLSCAGVAPEVALLVCHRHVAERGERYAAAGMSSL